MESGRPRNSKRRDDLRGINANNDQRAVSYEEAFNKTGFGLWQYLLLLQCGWANASDAMEIMCISFIIPSVRDTMKVSHMELSALTFVLFFGMLVGGYIWGSLADTYGRRQIVYISLAVNAIFGALSSVVETYPLLLFLRFISGFGAGGSLPAVFTYFSEFQPTKYRGAMISALATCWMAGNIIIALLAWAVLPESEVLKSISPHGQQWRLFAILCAIPSLISAVLFFFMPESPKYLHVNNKLNESLLVLKKMYKWNHLKNNPYSFQIHKLLPIGPEESDPLFEEDVIYSQENGDNESANLLESSNNYSYKSPTAFPNRSQSRNIFTRFKEKFIFHLKMFHSQFVAIYAQSRRVNSIALTATYILCAFGGYGMAMWTVVLMEKTEKLGGSPCRGYSSNGTDILLHDTISDNSANAYIDVLIGACAQLPGNLLTIFLMDRLGARIILIFVLFLSALSVLCFWLVNVKAQVVAMNAIYSGIQVGAWNALDVITVEMYPTSIRSAATGNMNGISRLGSILGTTIFGLFMDLNCSVPILTVFSVYILCSLISIKLPNTRNITLD
ncbi:synaptic vesicle glycoprotein 2B-like [Styela clava]